MQRAAIFTGVLVAFFFLWSLAPAAVKKHAAGQITSDTSRIEPKKFNEGALQKIKADKEFDYHENAYNLSAWERFWSWVRDVFAWIWQLLTGWLTGVPYSGAVIEYLLLGVSLVLLVYFILKSRGIDLVKLWRGESKKAEIQYTETLENIHEIDFEIEVEKAISQHNYRLAVRLLYLKCLKQLSDRQLIQWQIDKTNGAYLCELTDPSQKQYFGQLTRQFEYIWYGNFFIDDRTFGNINQLFQDFKKQLP